MVPTPEVSPAVVLGVTPKGKSKEKESESRVASSERASQKSGKKKAKVPSQEVTQFSKESPIFENTIVEYDKNMFKFTSTTTI